MQRCVAGDQALATIDNRFEQARLSRRRLESVAPMSLPHRGPYNPRERTPPSFDPRHPRVARGSFPITLLIVSAALLVVIVSLILLAYRQATRASREADRPRIQSTMALGSANPSRADLDAQRLPAEQARVSAPATVRKAAPVFKAAVSEPSAPSKTPDREAKMNAITATPVVQIGAFASKALADAGWTSAMRAVPSVGVDKGKRVEEIRRDDKTLYRSLVTGFETHQAAAAFCSALQTAGEECFVRDASRSVAAVHRRSEEPSEP